MRFITKTNNLLLAAISMTNLFNKVLAGEEQEQCPDLKLANAGMTATQAKVGSLESANYDVDLAIAKKQGKGENPDGAAQGGNPPAGAPAPGAAPAPASGGAPAPAA
ncbi:hypothetical protein EDEG_00954 [Edhazardia aedis USNM 41457]|uniref:Uncharacterized protein n=1 Tax=Edhazardia aedis (strain USNM 41457) TaxID=1003232 RepID=J9DAS1_EDHAE|nr:hypothetical protein EDEG_00954 [Edhazardia aedis USNM 41457]|eukprot:EJW04861.1 hypothetical protein EDEG_00954 [Edhazardia aedis USNM 41457]